MTRNRFAALALLLFSCAGEAATWYVDCSAGTNGAGTSFSVPFNALASLNWTTIDTGNDDVLFKEGTTCVGQLDVQASGVSGDEIVLGVYNAADGSRVTDGSKRATIDRNNAGSSPIQIGVTGGVRSYVTVDGLDAKGSNSTSGVDGQIYSRDSSNITIKNFTVSGGSGTNQLGLVVRRGSAGGDNVTIQNGVASGFTSGNGVGVMIYQNAASTTASNFTVSGVTANGNNGTQGKGIWLACDFTGSNVFTNITISGSTASNNGTYPLDTFGVGIDLGCPTTNSTIANNTLENNGIAGIVQRTGTYGALAAASCAGTTISGNAITRAGRFGIWQYGCDYNVMRSNVISGVGAPTGNTYGRGIEIVDTAGVRDSTTATGTLGAGFNVAGATGVTLAATSEFASKTTAIIGQKVISIDHTNPGIAQVTGYTDTSNVVVTILYPFTSSTLTSNLWVHGAIPVGVRLERNVVSETLNYISNCSEGVGLSFDDYASLGHMTGNFIYNNEGTGIDINAGVGNKMRGNVILNNSRNCRGTPGVSYDTEIKQSGRASEYVNNTVLRWAKPGPGWNIFGAQGIRDATTTYTATYRNNLISGFYAGIFRHNTNDVETYNRFHNNTYDVRLNNDTASTIDATSTSGDPSLTVAAPADVEGFRPRDGSPLCGAGFKAPPFVGTDYFGKRFGPAPSVGAVACR